MKNVKRINESQLRAIVAESLKKVLNEGVDTIGSDVLDAAQWQEGRKVAQMYNEAITHCGVDDAMYVKILQQVLEWMRRSSKTLSESTEYGDRHNDDAQDMLRELYMKAQNTEGYFQDECYQILNNVSDYAGLSLDETIPVRKQMEKIMMDCRQLRKMIGDLGVIENI